VIETNFENPIKKFKINKITDVETAVSNLRDIWKLGNCPIASVLKLLEDKCFKIFLIDTGKEFDGFSCYRGVNPVIVLNKKYPIDRLRFTALHETGHLLLNISHHFSEKEQEKICHRFAGALLISKEIFRTKFGGHRRLLALKELTDIKEEFGISIAAIMARAKDLNLISEQVYTGFCINYNKNGWKDKEPGNFVGDESSNRFEQLLQRAAAAEILSLSKCATLIKKPLAEFRHEVEFIP
jgi:Zn-dependent peptidase ImmA (M78 family)